MSTSSTTLTKSIGFLGENKSGYTKLSYQKPWPIMTCTMNAEAGDGARSSLLPCTQTTSSKKVSGILAFFHLSDIHLIDVNSPLRTEFMRNYQGEFLSPTAFDAAWRPQEALSFQVAEAMIRKINALSQAPSPNISNSYSFAVMTGDSIDNTQLNSLQNFISLMDGGKQLYPFDALPYNGIKLSTVGASDSGWKPNIMNDYWHPDLINGGDNYYSTYGFPSQPGLLGEAAQPFTASGLQIPWYNCYGNHDRLVQGNIPVNGSSSNLNQIAIGSKKILDLPGEFKSKHTILQKLKMDLFSIDFLFHSKHFVNKWLKNAPYYEVQSNPNRQLTDASGYIAQHFKSASKPLGHGFSQNGPLYYSFPASNQILGIVLDTTNPGGLDNGSLDAKQVSWLKNQLASAQVKQQLVILYSHHNSQTLTNRRTPTELDPFAEDKTRMIGKDFIRLLHQYPNVVLWLSGHTHFSRIYQHPDPTMQSGGFWEIVTPSLIDFPQQARIIEIADNKDSTLSIYATLIDTAAPIGGSTDPVLNLASISRELAANDPEVVGINGEKLLNQIGEINERNVQLMIKKPF